MSSISSASLIVAASQLREVQLVISAMRAADIEVASGAAGGAAPLVNFPEPPLQFPHAPPVFPAEPHLHYQPLPATLPQRMLHITPRVAQTSQSSCRACECQTPPKQVEPTFQPPWRVMPWPTHSPDVEVIKIVPPQPDMLVKGLLIDIFV